MRKFLWLFMPLVLISCGQNKNVGSVPVITVSIAPFSYFVEQIAGSDFEVNIMVPAGSNPHIYEPFPEQITKLRSSVAYISNGYLGFEMTWLDRFYETNKTMKKLSLAEGIEPLDSGHQHEGDHVEGADPHYWVSPKCAKVMAASVNELLCTLNPSRKDLYLLNYNRLISRIDSVDKKCEELFTGLAGRSFMIYHPNLGYLARDYGLEEISVEFEGKEPPPARLKELIDKARSERLSTIFVQKEYDAKNARAIAGEIGIGITIIDPLSANWYNAENDIINSVYSSLTNNNKPVK
jgi:zinc transport system substrate-binding protein